MSEKESGNLLFSGKSSEVGLFETPKPVPSIVALIWEAEAREES